MTLIVLISIGIAAAIFGALMVFTLVVVGRRPGGPGPNANDGFFSSAERPADRPFD
jgi:hypothetical protein